MSTAEKSPAFFFRWQFAGLFNKDTTIEYNLCVNLSANLHCSTAMGR